MPITTKLFGRAWSVTVGDISISDSSDGEGLACEFSVKKTLKVEPNTCSLKVWNLAEHTRTALTSPKRTIVRIEAGYADRQSQIYLGEVRALAPGEQSGPNIITELTSGDGEKAMATARLAVPIGAKTANGVALKAIAKELKLGLGNIPAVAAKLATKGSTVFPRATVVTGKVERALTDFCRAAGLEWSVQDGAIQILDLGFGLERNPYVLSADSGLIGAPSVGSDGKVTCETLMIPELRPGLRVQLETLTATGLYRVIEANYSGQTHGSDWKIRLTLELPGKIA